MWTSPERFSRPKSGPSTAPAGRHSRPTSHFAELHAFEMAPLSTHKERMSPGGRGLSGRGSLAIEAAPLKIGTIQHIRL
jgi:hypothetical protein